MFERAAADGDYAGEADDSPFLDLEDGERLGLPGFPLNLRDFFFPFGVDPASILLRGLLALSGPRLEYLGVAN